MSQERKKLDNLTKNIYAELGNNKQLKDLDDEKKRKIEEIAKNAEEWLSRNKNASDLELRNYMKEMWVLLGDNTNFKFSVWTVANYGIGYGFSEQMKWGSSGGIAKDLSHYSTTFLKKGGDIITTNKQEKDLKNSEKNWISRL